MATLEEYANWIIKNKEKANTPDFLKVQNAYQALREAQERGRVYDEEQMSDRAVKARAQQNADRKTYSPVNDTSDAQRFRAGFGKAFSDIGQGISQYLPGGATRQDVAESRRLSAPLMETGAGMAGNVTGNVAAAVPVAFVPGANTATGGALTGALMGATAPSVSSGETLRNIGLGGAGGAVVPVVSTAAKIGKSFVEPLYQSGRNQIMGRALRKAAGEGADQALTAMQTNKSAIPGVELTAAEAAQNPGIAAMQRTATAVDPVAMNQLAERQLNNNDALIRALKGLAPDKAAATAARDAATTPLYKQAYGETIQQTPELAALMKRPSMTGALGRGQSLAREQGAPMTMNPGAPAGAPQPSAILNAQGQPISMSAGTPAIAPSMTGRDAHLMKMGLDDMANAAPMTGIGGNELRAIQGTRADFLGEIEKQVPSYGQARQAYADLSKPLNQADVVEQIANAATNFRGNLTPAAYAKALSDKTVQTVTGQKNATLSKVMSPEQLKTMSGIKDDLLRADFANTAGRGVGSDTVQKLAFSNMMGQSGLPNWITSSTLGGITGNLAQRAGQVVYKDANEKMAAQLAQALLNPQDASKLMEAGMVTPEMIKLANGLKRSGAVLGGSAPGLIQANQQDALQP